jgi:hypothetical protein
MKDLQLFYQGFFLREPIGNNAFSYAKRQSKEIYVAPLLNGGLKDLAIGEQIAFSEVLEDKEINKQGLKVFLHLKRNGKDIFIFDNHNHAFFFWVWGFKSGRFPRGASLVHVDQHTDLREPDRYLDKEFLETMDLRDVFEYTNRHLNVGNFIKPAVACGMFARVEMITGSDDFRKECRDCSVLDLDMDFFSADMDYIAYDVKVAKIKELIEIAPFITIATSPYFMEQQKAIDIIKELLK